MGTHRLTAGHRHAQHSRLHEDFLKAIEDELAALDEKGHADAMPVGAGTLVRHDSGCWCYRFNLSDRAGGLRPGASVGFQTESTLIPGHVIARRDDAVIVSLGEDLGLRSPPGHLLVDGRWILIALQRRVAAVQQSVRAGRYPLDLAAAGRVLGIGDLDGPAEPIPLAAPAPNTLNTAQKGVVLGAHTRRILHVWGPPGTGKTSSLHAAVCSLLAAGQRVLFATPTNLAADAIIECGTERLRESAGSVDGVILRVGPQDGITLSAGLCDEFSLHSAVLRRIDGVSMPGSEAYRQTSARLVREARLVVTTIHQTFLSPLLADSRFDVLIVDEASMIHPIALYLAAGLAERSVIAGDFRQLPPVVHADTVSANAWLRRDAFEAAGIPDDVERGDYPPYLVVLTQQYRMGESICSLVAAAYDAGLGTDDSVLARPAGALGPHGVLYINSESGACVEVTPGGSRRNAAHVASVAALLERILRSSRLDRRGLSQLLIVTPFLAQARLYDQVLREKFGRHAPRVRTAHRIQGREADIVLLDLVDGSGGSSVSRFLSGSTYRTEAGRMLTVAASRAREHLIVIADFELMHDQRVGRVVREFLRKVVSVGRRITTRLVAAR